MTYFINFTLLKEQLKRFWTVGALTLILYVLAIVLPIYQNDDFYTIKIDSLISLLSMSNPVMVVASIVVPLLLVMLTFSYLFQPKTTATIHSYPINKRQLFFTNVLTGFLVFAIPLLVLCVIMLSPIKFVEAYIPYYGNGLQLPTEIFPNGLVQNEVINSFSVITGFFFRAMLTFSFYYAIFLLSAMLSGSPFIFLLMSIAIPLLPTGAYILKYVISTYYTFGYSSFSSSDMVETILMYSNPVFWYDSFTHYFLRQGIDAIIPEPTSHLSFILTYLAVGASALFAAYFCSRVRKQERAGEAFVFSYVRTFVIFAASVAGMVFLGALFLSIFYSTAMMYVGFVLGFSIAFILVQMASEKSFTVFHKWKELVKYGGVAVVGFLIIVAAIKLDVTGFQKYVPKAEDVVGVYLHYPSVYSYSGENVVGDMIITDTDIIEKSLAIHKEIIKNKGSLLDVRLKTISNSYKEKYGSVYTQYFVYKLKNGKTVLRDYILPHAFLQKVGLVDLNLDVRVAYSSIYSFKASEKIESVSVRMFPVDIDEYDATIMIEDLELIPPLVEELKKDYYETKRGSFTNPEANENKYYENEPYLSINMTGYSHNRNTRYYDGFSLTSFDNTLAWLKANGYIKE